MQETKERACRVLWVFTNGRKNKNNRNSNCVACHCYGLCHVGIGYFCKTWQKKWNVSFIWPVTISLSIVQVWALTDFVKCC